MKLSTSPTLTAQDLVRHFDMQLHPEGGFYKETYRSTGVIYTSSEQEKFAGKNEEAHRSYCTGIYFLLPQGSQSRLHRIASDEMWHFYLGGSLTIIQISPEGKVEEIRLGNQIQEGEVVQHVVPAGYWFGSFPNPESAYSFVGCTVSPGFDFRDFELADRGQLLAEYPAAREAIERLT